MTITGKSSQSGTHYWRAWKAGQIYDGAAYEDYSSGSYADYDIAATSEGLGIFTGTVPNDADFAELAYQSGGSPAAGDSVEWILSGGELKALLALPDAATNTGSGIATAQEIARMITKSPSAYFVGTAGNDSNDGLSPSSAKLTVAAAASAGAINSAIVVLAGEFEETSMVTLKDGQGLYGAGMFRTRIHNDTTGEEPGGVVISADRSEIHTIYVNGTMADGTFQAAISQYNLNTGLPVTSGLFNVRAKSDADGVYLRGTNSSEYSTIYVFDSIVEANYDAMAQFQYSRTYTFGKSMYRAVGPSTVTDWPGSTAAVKSSGTAGDQYLFGTAIIAKDGTSETAGSVKAGSGDVMFFDCSLHTKSAAGTVYDLTTGSGGAIWIRNSSYDPAKVNGTIIPTVRNPPLNAAEIRASVGMASADLDTQLDGIVTGAGDATAANQDTIIKLIQSGGRS